MWPNRRLIFSITGRAEDIDIHGKSPMNTDFSETAKSDENVKRLVVEELYWDSRVDASKVTAEVADGVVTLRGRVPTLADKFSAEADARLIDDVVAVENQIEVVQPEILPDRELIDTVIRTLDWTPDLNASDLEAFATDGTVTLRGTVPSYLQKRRAQLLAARITGVVRVVDEIAVAPLETPDDQRIAGVLERFLDRRLRDDLPSIQVTVADGAVTLTGRVSHASHRQMIEEAAECIVGVKEINNELHVLPQTGDGR